MIRTLIIEPEKERIEVLIRTHGLLGMYVRGEVNLGVHKPLTMLVSSGKIQKETMENLLMALNHCIIAGVNVTLWDSIKEKCMIAVQKICEGVNQEIDTLSRLQMLFPAYRKVMTLEDREKTVYDAIFANSSHQTT